MVEKFFKNQVDYIVKIACRVNLLKLLGCCIITKTIPFNSVVNVNYD